MNTTASHPTPVDDIVAIEALLLLVTHEAMGGHAAMEVQTLRRELRHALEHVQHFPKAEARRHADRAVAVDGPLRNPTGMPNGSPSPPLVDPCSYEGSSAFQVTGAGYARLNWQFRNLLPRVSGNAAVRVSSTAQSASEQDWIRRLLLVVAAFQEENRWRPLSTTQARKVMTTVYPLAEDDAAPLRGRKDALFSQRIRNIVSNRRHIEDAHGRVREFAVLDNVPVLQYIDREGFLITREGQRKAAAILAGTVMSLRAMTESRAPSVSPVARRLPIGSSASAETGHRKSVCKPK